jgi:hypothetical protein
VRAIAAAVSPTKRRRLSMDATPSGDRSVGPGRRVVRSVESGFGKINAAKGACGLISLVPRLRGRDKRSLLLEGWGEGLSPRNPCRVEGPSPHPVSHFAALMRADPPPPGEGKEERAPYSSSSP